MEEYVSRKEDIENKILKHVASHPSNTFTIVDTLSIMYTSIKDCDISNRIWSLVDSGAILLNKDSLFEITDRGIDQMNEYKCDILTEEQEIKNPILESLKEDINVFLYARLPSKCTLAVFDDVSCNIYDIILEEWDNV